MADQKKKGYDFERVESKILKLWDQNKTYRFDPNKKGKIYSVDTPPPTVSGKMHLGHAFSYSQQDFIVRFRRMNGNVYYPFGTDDNGLPTERLVEKMKNVKSKEMSRAEFIELCLKTILEIRPDFINDWKRLGVSADYDLCYSTIDENSRKIAQKGFIELFKKKEIYKDEIPTIWCCECQTAIAQAELEDKDLPSQFSTLKFKTGNDDLLIATTRPELLPACVAVFVHPSDKRYKKFVGKTATVPLFNQEVPILEDESADPEKGTGVLMICSYGDKFDVDAINRHKLKPKIVFNNDGTANYSGYEGLSIKDARKKVFGDLDEAGLITEKKSINHSVNVHDKCGTPIEFLPTPQWFIKVIDKKKKLLEQGKKIKWYPEHMKKRYDNWINGLEWDWNISRNRHFGIPIPVWECESCNEVVLPDEKDLPIDPLQEKRECSKCGKEARPEEMVLDTWAISSLSPQIASNLIDDKIKIPYSLRPQGHDIIRTWAFYTIVRSLMHENKLPWEETVISGMVTMKGEKMAKSKGNGIDPQDVMNEYGSDALRYWASSSNLGSDLDYQEQDLLAGKKTINKIWNATKFVFMNLEDYDYKKPTRLEKMDELFLTRLGQAVERVTDFFNEYEYARARQEIDRFFWSDFTDNYLEIVKKRVYQGSGMSKKSAQFVLHKSLLAIVKMFAPIMPFVTEEIYLEYFKNHEKDDSIHLSSWPKIENVDKESVKEMKVFEEFLGILEEVRKVKSEAQKSMKAEVEIVLEKKIYKNLEKTLEDLKNVTNAVSVESGNKTKIVLVEGSD